ncbi:MAG: hypothetical protein LBN27_10480 [Prevotellaceae bacterium]|jgi:hypothetical protein|nr:hypothetical protein [Prevotellaceae bacterium]
MKTKSYTFEEVGTAGVAEPAIAYQRTTSWNPNVPFSGTQDEWWEYFMQIENGQFHSLETANREFNVWKKDYLAKNF